MSAAPDNACLPRVALIVHTQKRRNLLCIRIGKPGVFERWFRAGSPRNWDLLLSCYSPTSVQHVADVVAIGGLSKFSAIKDIYAADGSIFGGYQFIWFLDDDIELAFADVDAFFAAMGQFDLSLAQPALTADSFMTWPITRHDPDCSARLTNFVEIMMPAFSQRAFQLCVASFDRSISGFGLDFLWPKLLLDSCPTARIGIIDTVSARHTKPMDVHAGPFYTYLESIGVDFRAEFSEICESFSLKKDSLPRILSKIPRPAPLRTQEATMAVDAPELRSLYLDTMERVLVGMIYRDQSFEPWGKHTYNEPMRLAGRDWPTMAHTMIGLKRLHNLRELTEAVLCQGIPGDFI
jgi:hypothetical protein